MTALRDYGASPRFNAAEKAALSAAESMTRDATGLAEPVWRDLRAHFDDGEIVEIVCTIGLFNYFNRVNNALQIEITR
ncbi:MAG: hypothetical protein GIW99_10750 [Candidatus Eremiobacteraeota bacterium]|nr:hypothetical protein [Candidatus Eremiobacteraeota bacterium]MBC5828141.1 hypothetical protein [Candidatus Eremiobacteraeota bacterium]